MIFSLKRAGYIVAVSSLLTLLLFFASTAPNAIAQSTPAPQTTAGLVAGTAFSTAVSAVGNAASVVGGPLVAAGTTAVADATNRAVNNAVNNALAPSPNAGVCEDGSFLQKTGCVVTKIVQGIIFSIIGAIVDFLGKILLICIDILLGFVAYNGFGEAIPVIKGWVIVRDVANMFFIVILVVSAISTIIDYNDAYHYKKVLPKLLLMAILINFSRTFIMLLVDFSQVVMLTFVNGFKAAAAGNFVNAFGLSKLLNISNSQGVNIGEGSVPNGISFVDLFSAYLLAIMMICISIGIVAIMIAYFIFRIIGIWMLLIFAPLAFLLTALPEPLKKKISFGDDYWKKLGTLLTGGPIMAFFLWLTLAVVQSSTNSLPTAGTASQVSGPGLGGGGAAFLTNIGTAPEIATFIVAITMLLMGLEQATSIAKDVGSSALTNFAKGASDKARGAAKWVGMAPINKGKRVIQATDDRYKVMEKVSRGALTGLSKVPNFAKGVIPSSVVGALGAGITMSKKRQEADAKNTAKLAEGLSAEDQKLVAGTISTGDGLLSGSSAGERLGRADILAGTASVESRAKQTKKLSGEIKNQLTAERASGGNSMSDEEIKRTADSMAMDEIDKKVADALKEARSMYEKAGNKDKVGEVDKVLEKDPQLETDPAKFDSLMTTIKNDPEKIKALSPGALSSGKVLMSLLPAGSVKRDPATGNIKGIDESQFQSLLESDGVKGNKLLTGNLQTLKSTIGGKKNGISGADLERAMVQRDKYGTNGMYSTIPGQGRITNDYQEDARTALRGVAPSLQAGVVNDSEKAIIKNALSNNIPLTEVMGHAGTHRDKLAEGLGDIMATQMSEIASAGDKAALDVAFEPISSIARDLDSQGIESSVRITTLASLGAFGGPTMEKVWNMGDKNQQGVVVKIAEMATQLASQVATKRAKDPTSVSRAEEEVEKLFASLRTVFDPNDRNTPSAMRMALQPSSKTTTT